MHGRIADDYVIGDRAVSAAEVEHTVFRLPIGHGVLFWRGQAAGDRLRVQIEVAPADAKAAVADLRALLVETFGVPTEVDAVEPGTIMPLDVLEGTRRTAKPRRFFGPGENWDEAVIQA